MNMKRMRGRGHRGNNNNNNNGAGGGGSRHLNGGIPLNRNHVFDSNGPEVRVRGTAQQLYEKYQQLGRDATSTGDRVAAEGYFQHAEHYFRILSYMNQNQPQNHQGQGSHFQRRQDGGNDSDGEGTPAAAEVSVERPSLSPMERIAGLGEQPTLELREIPIAAEPPVEA